MEQNGTKWNKTEQVGTGRNKSEQVETKNFIEIIEELNTKNGKLEKENTVLKEKLDKKMLDEKKLDLKTFHTDPAYYKQVESYEKDMTMFYLKLRMKVAFGIIGFAALMMLIGLVICQ